MSGLQRKLAILFAKLLAKARRLQRFWRHFDKVEQEIRQLRQAAPDPALEGKVVIITGSSRNIGLTLAQTFFLRGASVVINGRHQTELDSALRWFQDKDPARAIGVCCDITEPSAAQTLLQQALARFGRVDILINNAGVMGPFTQKAWAVSDTDWRQTMAVNLDGAFYCSKAVMQWMVEHQSAGRIINVSSGAATAGMPLLTPYATSKAALEALTRNLAADADGSGIMVCAIELGSTQSDMTRHYFPLEQYLQLPPPELHMPVFLHAATADAGLLHGRSIAAWRFRDKGEDESWLAASIAYGGKLEIKPRQIPEHLSKDQIAFLEMAENQFGPSPAVQQFLHTQTGDWPVSEYPDPNYQSLRQTLADRLGLGPAQLAFGNGSSELVERLLRVFVHPGESVLSNDPSWFVFDRFCGLYGISNLKVPFAADPRQGLQHDLDRILHTLRGDTRLIYLIHPSNPIGVPLLHEPFLRFLDQLPRHIPVVVDEAYIEYADPDRQDILDTLAVVKQHPHPVIGLRTFSKIYGLAGMRVGYAYASTRMIQLLDKLELPFNLATLAAESARVVLQDEDFVRRVRDNAISEKRRISEFLQSTGLDYIPSQSSMMLAQYPSATADDFYPRLRDAGILLSPVSYFGKYFLWPIGLPQQNDRIMAVIREIL